jgi:hypothetical protein
MTITEIPADAFTGEAQTGADYDGGVVTPWAPYNVEELMADEAV